MTDVSKNNHRLISTPDQARGLYTKMPESFSGKIGLEVEMHLFVPQDKGPGIPSPVAMEGLRQALAARGHDAQLEATGVLEYASPPAPVAEVPALIARVGIDLAAFEAEALAAGYARAPFSLMPSMTVDDARARMGDRERLRVGIKAVQEIFPEGACRVPLLTTGVQASLSPRDVGEMHRMAMRAYALTPLLIAAMNSTSGFAEGRKADHHPRGRFYEAYGASGGISRAFLESDTAEAFVDNHIREVFKAPMPFAYDAEERMKPSTAGDILTFERLVEKGLGTQANYELAESFLYHDVKICNLRGADGQTLGKRIEVRAADSGLHQPASVLLLTAALIPDGPSATAFEDLLRDFGFSGLMPDDGKLLVEARAAAVDHGGKFMDVPFGRDPKTGQPRRLMDLAAGVAAIVSAHYKGQDVAAEVGTLVNILQSGDCDARRFASSFATPQEAEKYLQAQAVNVRGSAPEIPPAGRHLRGKRQGNGL